MAGGDGALRQIFAYLGFEFDADKLSKADKGVDQLTRKVKTLAGTLGALAIVRGLATFAEDFAANAEQIRVNAERVGVSTDVFQEMGYAAGAAGVPQARLGAALGALEVRLGAANKAGAKVRSTLLGLGVMTSVGGHARAVTDIVADLAVAMDRVDGATRRNAIAQQVGGRQLRNLMPILHGGAGGLAALVAEYRELGGGVTHEAIEASRKFAGEQRRLGVVTDGLRSTLAVALLPALSWLIEKGVKLVHGFDLLTRGTYMAKLGVVALLGAAVALAAPAVAALAPILVPIAGITAGAVLAMLAIDDFLTLMKGGDSLIGRFLDRTYGMGTSAKFARALHHAFEAVHALLGGLIKDAGFLFGTQLPRDLAAIVKFLGTVDRILGRIHLKLTDLAMPPWLGSVRNALGQIGGGGAAQAAAGQDTPAPRRPQATRRGARNRSRRRSWGTSISG